jgi:hypothetical protein
MAKFTTNWYLYKTHFHNLSTQSQTQDSETKTYVHGSREENNIPIRKLKVNLKQ